MNSSVGVILLSGAVKWLTLYSQREMEGMLMGSLIFLKNTTQNKQFPVLRSIISTTVEFGKAKARQCN